MKFCDNCDSKLIKTIEGFKCPLCDREIIQKTNEEKIFDTTPRYSKEYDFPFTKNQYCKSKEAREILGCHFMHGINYRNGVLYLFMHAHKSKHNQSNPYQDRYNPSTGLFHYTGRGTKNDQKLIGVNLIIYNSNVNNIPIHLFAECQSKGKHRYVGKVICEKTIEAYQDGLDGESRKVYEFLLRPEPF